MGGMCSWGMDVGSGGRWGESCSRRGPRRGIFWGMFIGVMTMRAPLASLARLTGMVICVCVIAIGEERGVCRFWI